MSEGTKIKNLFKWAVITGLVLSLFLVAHRASAQTAGQGLELSPPLVQISTDPGKTETFQIRVRNITKNTVIAKPQINDFVAQGEEGQAKLLLNENPSEPSPYSIKGWVSPLADLRLVPNEIKTEQITLNVPKGASPGGHYGVIRFTAVPEGFEGTGVSLSASVGTLALIRVSGNIVEKASFVEFYTQSGGHKKSLFEYGPVGFVERIRNEGNVHFKPSGTIRITNFFGKEVAVLPINNKGGNVLPASIRRFEETLNKKSLFGRYRAEANIQFDGHSLSKSISFWVIPYKKIAVALGVILIVIGLIRVNTRRAVKKAVSSPRSSSKKKDKR